MSVHYQKVIKHYIYKIINRIVSLFPIKNHRVFFISFYGKTYSDNPKAISEALYDKYGGKYDYVWAIDSKKGIPFYIKTCKYGTIKMMYYMSTSKVWVSNFCLPKGTYKKKSQFYIQTWHGDKAFKKILHDVPSRDGFDKWLFETDKADLMVAGSEYGERQYRTAFLYKGDVLKCGTPRNDLFFKDTTELQKKIRKEFDCNENDRIVMYAPTFRRNNRDGILELNFDYRKAIKILEETTGDSWKIMVRTHSADHRKLIGVDGRRCIDVSDYPNINELLLITDILITDFSSIAGDFALTNRHILLYLYDSENYYSKDRELYFDIENSPFFQTTKEKGVYDYLESIGRIDANKNCSDILSFYGNYESGNTSQVIAEIIDSQSNID